jgi:hypothetical protein
MEASAISPSLPDPVETSGFVLHDQPGVEA